MASTIVERWNLNKRMFLGGCSYYEEFAPTRDRTQNRDSESRCIFSFKDFAAEETATLETRGSLQPYLGDVYGTVDAVLPLLPPRKGLLCESIRGSWFAPRVARDISPATHSFWVSIMAPTREGLGVMKSRVIPGKSILVYGNLLRYDYLDSDGVPFERMATLDIVSILQEARCTLAGGGYLSKYGPTPDLSKAGGCVLSFKGMSPAYEVHGDAYMRGFLRKYKVGAMGEVDDVFFMPDGVTIRLKCPLRASCATTAFFDAQIAALEEILDTDRRTMGNFVGSTWFDSSRQWEDAVPKPGCFYRRHKINIKSDCEEELEWLKELVHNTALLRVLLCFQRHDRLDAGSGNYIRSYSLLAKMMTGLPSNMVAKKDAGYSHGRFALAAAKYGRDFLPLRNQSCDSHTYFLFKSYPDRVNGDLDRKKYLENYNALIFGHVNEVFMTEDGSVFLRLERPKDATCAVADAYQNQLDCMKGILQEDSVDPGATVFVTWMDCSALNEDMIPVPDCFYVMVNPMFGSEIVRKLRVDREIMMQTQISRVDKRSDAGLNVSYTLAAMTYDVHSVGYFPRKVHCLFGYICDLNGQIGCCLLGVISPVDPELPTSPGVPHTSDNLSQILGGGPSPVLPLTMQAITSAGTFSLALAEYGKDFVATRERTHDGMSLFYFRRIAPNFVDFEAPVKQELKQYVCNVFGIFLGIYDLPTTGKFTTCIAIGRPPNPSCEVDDIYSKQIEVMKDIMRQDEISLVTLRARNKASKQRILSDLWVPGNVGRPMQAVVVMERRIRDTCGPMQRVTI
ncbi:hypothetical protein C8R43DRAFT_957105 [Mycena crocata]|nr:hypothetical protein C8R43DRAFT_957105 [Mycena crocata]